MYSFRIGLIFAHLATSVLAVDCEPALKKCSSESLDRLKARKIEVSEENSLEKNLFVRSLRFNSLSANDKVAAKKQEEEAIQFAADMFVELHGNIQRMPFREIEIAPAETLPRGEKIDLQGDRLVIGVGKGFFGRGRKVLNKDELRGLWNEGEHFSKEPEIKKYWNFLNPVGGFRSFARKELHTVREQLQTSLSSILKRAQSDPERALSQFRSLIASEVSSEKLSAESKKKLADVTTNNVETIAKDWKNRLETSEDVEGTINAAQRKVLKLRSTQGSEIDVVTTGLVAYGNFHDIQVGISASSGNYDDLVEVASEPFKVKARSYGVFFGGYTIDRVHVFIDFHQAVPTSSLDRALSGN
jgi:hypothetical protein